MMELNRSAEIGKELVLFCSFFVSLFCSIALFISSIY
jgi:hypothetical protein